MVRLTDLLSDTISIKGKQLSLKSLFYRQNNLLHNIFFFLPMTINKIVLLETYICLSLQHSKTFAFVSRTKEKTRYLQNNTRKVSARIRKQLSQQT